MRGEEIKRRRAYTKKWGARHDRMLILTNTTYELPNLISMVRCSEAKLELEGSETLLRCKAYDCMSMHST